MINDGENRNPKSSTNPIPQDTTDTIDTRHKRYDSEEGISTTQPKEEVHQKDVSAPHGPRAGAGRAASHCCACWFQTSRNAKRQHGSVPRQPPRQRARAKLRAVLLVHGAQRSEGGARPPGDDHRALHGRLLQQHRQAGKNANPSNLGFEILIFIFWGSDMKGSGHGLVKY